MRICRSTKRTCKRMILCSWKIELTPTQFLLGDRTGNKLSPATALEELLKLESVQRNWAVRHSCTESNIRKYFTRWTREKKIAEKKAATTASSTTNSTCQTTLDEVALTNVASTEMSVPVTISDEFVDGLDLDTDGSKLFECVADIPDDDYINQSR